MRYWARLAALLLALGSGAAAAAERLVVVELFTSQGCSSCPPADAILAELAGMDHVLPLALHVDYWDYLGWKDSFASPVFSRRQKLYARAAGASTVYTPQMIIDGTEHVVGSKPMKVMAALERHAGAAPAARIEITRRDGRVEVAVAPLAPLAPRSYVILLVRYAPEATVEIRRGENAGRTITYRNIVAEMTSLGTWDGQSRTKASAPVRGPGALAAIVQEPYGPVLAAARLR